jgi:VCBS repeat-containing protein
MHRERLPRRTSGSFAAAGTTINGLYGKLTFDAQGNYTYTRNANTPGGVNDTSATS